MILNTLKQFLQNKPYFSVVQPTPNYDNSDKIIFDKKIDFYIKDIARLLDVEIPPIQKVALLYESEGLVRGQLEFRENEIPEDAQYSGAYYLDKDNILILTQKYPLTDFYTADINYVDLTDAEQLFHIAHELRHVWQKQYHENIYYKKNAVSYEIINDPAEVDADAFALAYVFSKNSPFTVKDIPNVCEEICLQATADNGKRWSRATKLSAEYCFESTEKLEEVKASADSNKIRIIVDYLNINGLIS